MLPATSSCSSLVLLSLDSRISRSDNDDGVKVVSAKVLCGVLCVLYSRPDIRMR